MSLGTIVLLCLAALFFGGIVCLDRINRKRQGQETGSDKPTMTLARGSTATAAAAPTLSAPGTPAQVTPIARPKKNRSRELPRPQQRNGT